MTIKNDQGSIFVEATGEKVELNLEAGWWGETVSLSISVGEFVNTIELSRKELKSLKKEIKVLLDEWSE